MRLFAKILFAAGGASVAGSAGYLMLTVKAVPKHEPDVPALPPPPVGSTRYKLIDAILDKLRAAASSSGIPLGLMVGWIAKESGGRLSEVTKLDERGYFQLMPDESKSIGFDHQRLSTDSDYSIQAGVALIKKYAAQADGLSVAPKGSSYYWRLVKLGHTMGSGAAKKIVAGAKEAGAAGSWEALEAHALDNSVKYLLTTRHSPSKWFPLVDAVYDVGAKFGFGDESARPLVAGAPASALFMLGARRG